MRGTADRLHAIEASRAFSKRYSLEERLGTGGFASVYRGTQRSTGQTVAIKVLDRVAGEATASDVGAARFRREMELCAGLHHPHLVRLIDAGSTEEGWLYTVFEHVPGRTLARVLTEEKRLDPGEATKLMAEVLDAIACAHRRGIIHRDLKPSNVMISETGIRRSALVLDFGIGAISAELRDRELRRLTATHEALGTPSYAAPEQLRGDPATPRSDLYSWGLILLECVTGEPPIRGANLQEVLQKQLGPEPIEMPERLHGLPLGRAIAAAVPKRPEARAGSADELMAMLLDSGAFASGSRLDGALAGRKHQLTVLSLRASGSRDEESVEDRERQARAVQQELIDAVRAHGGEVAAALGSRVLALFGYPHAREEAARAALEAAAAAREVLAASPGGLGRVRLRAGIHSGLAIAPEGNRATRADLLSSPILDGAMDLEAEAGEGELWLSDAARRLLRWRVPLESLGSRTLGGEARPVPVFRLEGGIAELRSTASWMRAAPIFGRADELARLDSAWSQARAGRPGTLLVTGEGGIGKTRLIQALREKLGAEAWIECRCTPEAQNSPLQPIVEWLDPWLRQQPLEAALEQLGLDPQELHPLLAELLGLPLDPRYPARPLEPVLKRQRTLRALVTLLCARSRLGPLAFVIEDLHWSDPTTLEFLSLLVGELHSSAIFEPEPKLPLLALFSARREFRPPWSSSDVHVIALARLSRADGAALVRSVAAGSPLSADVVDRVVERADGVPLFLEQMGRMVAESSWREAAAPTERGAQAVPATLRELLSVRIDRLPPEVRRTAQTAACIGRDFELALLLGVAEREEELLRDDLEALVLARILHRRSSLLGERFVFDHALLRDTAYESMLAAERRAVHLKIATSLAGESFKSVATQQPELLAYHFEEGGAPEPAIDLRLRAGQRASARSAHREAIHHYGRALELLLSLPASQERDQRELELRLAIGNAYITTRGYADERVEREFERAIEICKHSPDTPRLFPAMNGLWGYHLVRGDLEATSLLVARQRELAERSQRPVQRLLATHAAGTFSFFVGDYARALPLLSEAADLYEAACQAHLAGGGYRPWRTPATSSPLYLGWCLQLMGRPERAMARHLRALELAERIGEPYVHVEAMTHLVALLHDRQEPEQTLELSDRIVELSEELGFRLWLGVGKSARGWARSRLGAIEEGIAEIEAGLEIFRTTGSMVPLVYRLSDLAEALLLARRTGEALAVIDEAFACTAGRLDRFYDAEMLRLRGECLEQTGERDDARREFRRAIELSREQGARLLELRSAVSLSRSLAGAGSRGEACEVLAPRLRAFDEGFETPDLRSAAGLLASLAG